LKEMDYHFSFQFLLSNSCPSGIFSNADNPVFVNFC
jgi:hypothetical protein